MRADSAFYAALAQQTSCWICFLKHWGNPIENWLKYKTVQKNCDVFFNRSYIIMGGIDGIKMLT